MTATTYLKHFLPTSDVLRRFFIFTIVLVPCLCFLFTHSAAAQVLPVNINPGDQFVFGADSPVAPSGNYQNGPALSDNIFMWSENETYFIPGNTVPSYRTRLFFKDLTPPKDPNALGKPLIDGQLEGNHPVISHDTRSDGSKRVVWQEYVNGVNHIYFKDINASGFDTCSGTVDQCASPVLPDTQTQANPEVSQDGSKVAWTQASGASSQVRAYDFNTGVAQIEPPQTDLYDVQSAPSVDNEWVVWQEAWNRNDINLFLDTGIYAKRIGSSDPVVKVAEIINNDYADVTSPKISRDSAGNPIVVYASSSSNGYTATTSIGLINLNDCQQTCPAPTIVQSSTLDAQSTPTNQLSFPNIDRDKIVWQDCPAHSADCNIDFHDMTSGVTQTVSQNTSVWPGTAQVSASSKYIAWRKNDQTNPVQIYYNRIGETAQTLADRYMPEFKMANNENFEPMPIEQFLTEQDNFLGNGCSFGTACIEKTALKQRNNSDFYIASPPSATLAQYAATSDLYVDLPGSSIAAGGGDPSISIDKNTVNYYYANPYKQHKNSHPSQVYSRVVSRPSGNANSFIQYWVFYYANDHPELFHEGDWEVVQVDLRGDLVPYRADYSVHGEGSWRNWPSEPGTSTHPVDYVAQGSHANYFYPDDHHIYTSGNSIPYSWDSAHGDGLTLNDPSDSNAKKTLDIVIPEVNHAGGTQFEWLIFKGQWGEYTGANVGVWPTLFGGERDGSDSPPIQGYWNNAFSWNNNKCDSCADDANAGTDLELTKHSPVDIRIYDSQGRVMGKNLSPTDIPIPRAEYLEYPELDRASIIIHGGQISDNYRIEADGNGSGPTELVLTAPDHAGGSVDTLDYKSIQVNPATKISATLDSSKSYTLSVDSNGDGTNIIRKAPDTTVTNTVDFTPPAQVSDLAGANTAYGSATLSFTAPGDDGNQGTATSYDVRYSTSAISDQYWNDAIPVGGLPAPLPAGSSQSKIVNNLAPGTTYYFALTTMDKVGLFSPISNVVSVYIPADTAAPIITNVLPNGWVTMSSPTVTASYNDADPSSGVNTASATLSLNGGAPITCTANAGSISCSTSSLADGHYSYSLSIADNAGHVGSASGSFDVDTVAPTLGSPTPSGIINTSTTNLTASYADSGSGVNSGNVQVSLDGTVVSGCTATATSVSCPISGLAEGAHNISVRVADVAGNISTSSGSFSVDTIAPTISNVLPNGWATSASPTVSANYSDLGSGINTVTATAKVDGNALSGCTITATSISCPSSSLAQGSHTLLVSVNDNATNAGSATGSFQVDNVPPVTSDNIPTGWQNANYNVTLTCTDATSGCASTSYELDGGATQTGNSVSITTEGTHTITYRSKDVANNTEVTRTATARLDKTPPATTDNAPTGWQNANFNGTLTCSDDTSGCASTTYELDGGATQTGNLVSITTEGTHTITYRSKDSANNTESTHTKTVELDKIGPSVSNVMPAGWINTASPTISASYSDSVSGINSATAVARIDGNIVAGCTVAAATISCPTSSLSQGSHTFTVSVSDNANNGGIGSSTFQVDTVAPSITNVQPSDLGTGTPGTQPSTTISASYSDAGSGINTSTASAKLDGASLSGCTITPSSISCAVSGLAPGNHTIAITAADNVGNIANGSGSFNVVRNYYWSWYDQHSSGYQDWVFFANPTWSSSSDWFNLKIASAAYSPGQVLIGQVLNTSYPTVIGGPVQAISTTGAKSIVSQRVLLPSNSLEEVPGQDSANLSDHYYWTWYDNTGGTTDWILVANQNASAVYYEIRIAGQLKTSGNLAAGANVTPTFPTSGGPVEVQAWTDSSKQTAAKVIASQRVLTNSGTAFNELPGTPAGSLSSTYYWTWYDNLSSGVTDWIMVSNQNASQIYYEITVAGQLKASGNLAAGANTYPTFPGIRSGPVKVQAWTSSNKQTSAQVISSQRTLYGPSFEEVPGYPQESLASDYHWPWYDYYSTNTPDYVMVANQNATQVYYEITVAGQLKASGMLAAGANATPAFSGLRSGPVEVQAWTDTSKQTTAKVISSQRVVWSGYFNEVLGQVLR